MILSLLSCGFTFSCCGLAAILQQRARPYEDDAFAGGQSYMGAVELTYKYAARPAAVDSLC
jgi:hypothetical protein